MPPLQASTSQVEEPGNSIMLKMKKKVAKPTVEHRESPKSESDSTLVAAIAASLMPRMNCSIQDPKLLRIHLERERSDRFKDDGATLMDVLMEEAILRAKLLISRVYGNESPTRRQFAGYVEEFSPGRKAVARVKNKIQGRTDPVPWREFAAWVLKSSNEHMWEQCWRGYHATEIELSHLAHADEEICVVWNSEATAGDRKNPKVWVCSDDRIPTSVPVDVAVRVAVGLHSFFRLEGNRIAQTLSRGRKKARGKSHEISQIGDAFVGELNSEHRGISLSPGLWNDP